MDRIGLVVELTGNEKAMASLRQLRSAADELNKKKLNLQLDKSSIDRQINGLKKNLAGLQNLKTKIKIDGKDTSTVEKHIANLKNKIAELTAQKNDITIDSKINDAGIRSANSLLREMQQNAHAVQDAMQMIGGGFSTAGNMLQSLGNKFGGNILSTMATTLTAYGTLMATQGLSTAIDRYDTFKTFPKLMEQIGYSTDDANNAVAKMNDAILGLPTGLNEIVESSKGYILALNDINKGSDLAIAANNAFLANASDAQQVYTGMRQIQDLLAKGELRNTEWVSLISSLGTSIQPIAEQLGYAKDEIGAFKAELADGAIDAQTFVDALIAVGTGTGALVERANIQKETLSATLSNIKNAFSITGYAILDEMDSLFQEYTGKTLPDAVKGISDAIKTKLKPAITGWMDENGDRIMGAFQKIADFDWMKLASSIGGAIDNLVTTFGRLVDAVPEDLLTSFITFATVWASPVGKAFSMLGGALKTLGGIRLTGLNGELTMLGKSLEKIHGIMTGAGTGVGGLMAGFGALLYGSYKYANYQTDQRYEDAYGRVRGGEASPETAIQAQRALADASRRQRELQASYDRIQSKMVDIYDAETDTTRKGYANRFDEEEARRLSIALSEQERVVDSLSAQYDALSAAEAQAAAASDTMTDAIEAQKQGTQDLKAYYDELKTSIRESLDSQINAFNELKVNAMSGADFAGIAKSNLDQVQQYEQAVTTIRNFQQELSKSGSFTDAAGNVLKEGAFDKYVSDILASQDIGHAMALAEQVAGYSINDSLNYLFEEINSAETIDKIKENISGMLSAATMEGEGINVFDEIGQKITEGLESVNEALGGEDSPMLQLQESMDGINEAVDQMQENFVKFGEMDTEGINEAITGIMEAFNFEELGEKGTAIAEAFQSIQETFSAMGEMDGAAIAEQLSGIVTQINALGGEEGGGLTATSEALNNMISALGEVDFSGAQSGAEELNGALEPLIGTLETTAGAFNNVTSAADSASSAVQSAASTASSVVGMFSGLIGVLGSVAGALSGAASAAYSLAAAINSIPSSKTVTVNYQQTGTVSPIGPAKGGYITPDYKATGGIIAWERMGTDTIPAMLTPGEFVIKKKATDLFRPVLERINSLDFGGMFDALMHIAPMKAIPALAYGPTYNRDNHASVNINNYGETGQGYSHRKAYKWVSKI